MHVLYYFDPVGDCTVTLKHLMRASLGAVVVQSMGGHTAFLVIMQLFRRRIANAALVIITTNDNLTCHTCDALSHG